MHKPRLSDVKLIYCLISVAMYKSLIVKRRLVTEAQSYTHDWYPGGHQWTNIKIPIGHRYTALAFAS